VKQYRIDILFISLVYRLFLKRAIVTPRLALANTRINWIVEKSITGI